MSSASLSLNVWAIRCTRSLVSVRSPSPVSENALQSQATTASQRYSRSASMIARTGSGTRWRIGSPAPTRRRISDDEMPISGIRTTSALPPSGVPGRGAHGDPRRGAHALRRVPAVERRQLVGAQQQHQVAVARGQLLERVGRVRRALAVDLDAAELEHRIARHERLRQAQAHLRRLGRRLAVRRHARGHDQHAVEAELPRGLAREQQVAEMRRVAERPEDAGGHGPRSRPRSCDDRQRDSSPTRISSPSRTPARRSAPITPRSSSSASSTAASCASSASMPPASSSRRRDAEPALLAEQPVAHAAADARAVDEVVRKAVAGDADRLALGRVAVQRRDQIGDALARRARDGDDQRPAVLAAQHAGVGLQLAGLDRVGERLANAARSSGGSRSILFTTTMRGRSARPWPCAASSP